MCHQLGRKGGRRRRGVLAEGGIDRDMLSLSLSLVLGTGLTAKPRDTFLALYSALQRFLAVQPSWRPQQRLQVPSGGSVHTPRAQSSSFLARVPDCCCCFDPEVGAEGEEEKGLYLVLFLLLDGGLA